jgi:hypothetical protein
MRTKEVNKKEIKSLIIANPIYDIVFKRLMENQRIVKFFLGTILGEQIDKVSVLPQEFTYKKGEDNKNGKKNGKWSMIDYYSIFRLDFVATVRTSDGKQKKILVEVQKSWDNMDVMRFRKYLGEQYAKEEIVNGKKTALPITTIYILGNNLPEIECPCIKTGCVCTDMRDQTPIKAKSEFIEQLTHDCYIIQAGRITDVRYNTSLDRLLGVFEQNYFVINNSDVMKEYRYQPGDENMELITDILREMAANAEDRKKIEDEKEALRVFNNAQEKLMETIEKHEKSIKEQEKSIKEQAKTLKEKDKSLKKKDKSLKEKDKSLKEKTKTLKEKDREIARLKRLLMEKQLE